MTENQKKQIDKMRFDGCGYMKIANAMGISENTIKSYCHRQKDNTKKFDCCAECGKAIDKSKRHGRRFCCKISIEHIHSPLKLVFGQFHFTGFLEYALLFLLFI
ncbi:MAG: hypothetical protein RR087_10540 [Oscillospiraceae bacterium]